MSSATGELLQRYRDRASVLKLRRDGRRRMRFVSFVINLRDDKVPLDPCLRSAVPLCILLIFLDFNVLQRDSQLRGSGRAKTDTERRDDTRTEEREREEGEGPRPHPSQKLSEFFA